MNGLKKRICESVLKALEIFSFALCIFFAGCEKEVKELVPPPPLPSENALVPDVLKNVSSTEEAKKFVSCGQSAMNVECDTKGVLKLRSKFSKGKRVRAYWDIKMPLDLSSCTSVTFDFYCRDLSNFSMMIIYFKSGNGWYSCEFAPYSEGEWVKVEIRKSEMSADGKCEGWEKISAVRISGWGAGEDGETTCYIANFTPVIRPNDVLIVYADSLMGNTSQSSSYIRFAGNIASTLSSLDIGSRIVADSDLSSKHFAGVKTVVLPYNPSLPPVAERLLRNYVKTGGKILACYTLPKFVAEVMGLRYERHYFPGKGGNKTIAGFLSADDALERQPPFSSQSSWISTVVKCSREHKIHAWWGDSDKKSLGIPALIGMKEGLFMTHVWLGGKSREQLEFMSAMMGHLSCDLASKAKTVIAKRRLEEERVRNRISKLPSKKGEFRAMWCHDARGLVGVNGWDKSVAILKENGFSAVFPNLAWGGIAFYESTVLPVASSVKINGDAFKACLNACRKYGVEIHPWKVCWNMGSYTSDEFVEKMEKEERIQVSGDGKKNKRWLCPSHPENKKMEIDAMVELASFKPDGIHFDYIRYSGVNNCFCDGCKSRFEKEYSLTITNWPKAILSSPQDSQLRRQWCDFRISNITYVVKSVSEKVRKNYPGVKISAAVFRNPRTDPDTLGQDWADWCKKGYVDAVHNMDYTQSPAMFKSIVKMQKSYVGSAKIYPGIGVSTWSDEVNHADVASRQILAVRELGLDGWTIFNYDKRVERILPLFRLGLTKED